MIDLEKYTKRYNNLNKEQQLAVDTLNGPVMVVAGPGTGKTELLALRIVNILRSTETQPAQILALTFTDSGVQAMRERLLGLLGTDAYKVNIFTFHAFCNQIIRDNTEDFSFSHELEHLTAIEKMKLLRKLIEELPNGALLKPFADTYHYLDTLERRIKTLKQEGITPEEFHKYVKGEQRILESVPAEEKTWQKGPHRGKVKSEYKDKEKQLNKYQELASIYEKYQKNLLASSRYDFEDMIMFVVKKLEEDADFREKYHNRFHFFLIDEYQDTNTSQNNVAAYLVQGQEEPNVFVVGDDDQAIYRFQGASLENILTFHKSFPKIKTIVLRKNYRSTQNIIDASTSLIVRNKQRITNHVQTLDKKFEAAQAIKGAKINLAQLSSEETEYFYILEKIKALHKMGQPLKEIAVFYRDNRDAFPLAELLKKEKIPFNLSVDTNALENYYIKKLISFLKVVNSTGNDPEFFRYLASDLANIDKEELFKLSAYIYRDKVHLFELLNDPPALEALNLQSLKELRAIHSAILDLRKARLDLPFDDFIARTLHRSGVIKALFTGEENLFDLTLVNSFVKWLRDQTAHNPHYNLDQFLTDIDFMNELGLIVPAEELYQNREGLNLMTAHKSKGLEFPIVFIIRANSQKWEAKRINEKLKLPAELILRSEAAEEVDDGIEDSRRLFYVAMTRAKEQIFLTCHTRKNDGSELLPSAFIKELEQEYIMIEDVKECEEKVSERIALNLAETGKEWKKEVSKEHLLELIKDYVMNPTALNNFLRCPLYFKYNNLYHIPGEYSSRSAIGNCIHKVLEKVFKEAATSNKVPEIAKWKEHFLAAIADLPFPEPEKEALEAEGLQLLEGYYQKYKDSFHTKCLTEYNFRLNEVRVDGIPITGKLDKVEILSDNKVDVIDYKTGAPRSRNDIMGETAAGNKDYYRQLVFYRLLCESDPNFPYKVNKAIIDFIKPRESGTYARVDFEIPDSALDSLKKELKDSYAKIQALDFQPTEERDYCKEGCEYKELCGRQE